MNLFAKQKQNHKHRNKCTVTKGEAVVVQLLSRAPLFVTPWTVVRQAPLSMGFSRQESWSGVPFLPPGDLPGPGIEPSTPALVGRFFTTEPPKGKGGVDKLGVWD